MLHYSIKYISIFICSYYQYAKLLNIKLNLKIFFVFIFLSSFMSTLSFYLNEFFKPYNKTLTFFLFIISVLVIFKINFNISVIASLIALAYNNATYLLASIIYAPIYLLLFNTYIRLDEMTSGSLIIISLFNALFSILPFKIRRFKNGMRFLLNNGSSDIAILLSTTILFCSIMLYIKNKESLYMTFVLVSVFCGLLIISWWKSKLKETYLKQIKLKEIENLTHVIEEKNKKIECLCADNSSLAQIIHKDNKLIPALEQFTKEISNEVLSTSQNDELTKKINSMNLNLKEIFSERLGALNTYEHKNRVIPKTNIVSVDAIISYLDQKAISLGIDCSYIFSADIIKLTENSISELELSTLIADLFENAIIAVSDSEIKNLLLHFGKSNDSFYLDFYDSGNDFAPEIIENLGLEQITTHTKTGGSGIGLMNMYALIKKYRGSILIDESLASHTYTKNISIWFDNKNKVLIKSKRKELQQLSSKRNDFLVYAD